MFILWKRYSITSWEAIKNKVLKSNSDKLSVAKYFLKKTKEMCDAFDHLATFLPIEYNVTIYY